MYLEPFKLKELPFRLSPDPQFLYLSKQHARAKAYMESTIWFTDGFVVITGEIGSGKTTLIESFLKQVPPDVAVAQINQTQVSAIDFLQAVLVQFGFTPFKMGKAELISTVNNYLTEQHAAGRKVLLIVDEAQNLTMRVLEEIRLLSGVETTKDKALRIILAGQPELNDKLNAPELAQLMQRVRLRFHLHTLSEAETQSYIQHRLDVAGAGDRQIFAPDTFAEVYRYCGGVPRLINTLCDTAMMTAYTADRSVVTRADIISAVRELQWVEYSARPQSQPEPRSETELPELPELQPQPEPPPRMEPPPRTEPPPRMEPQPRAQAQAEPESPPQPKRQPQPKVQPPPKSRAQAEPRPKPSEAAAGAPGSAVRQARPEPDRVETDAGGEPEVGPAVARLKVAAEGQTVQEISLRIGRIIIGRTPDNDVQIDSRYISRHHCQVITTAHSCVIEDLNSTNGIYVKSARVRRHHLDDGDVVVIGKHELIYVDERAARAQAAFSATIPPGARLSDVSPAVRSTPEDGAAASGADRKRATLAAAAERSAAAERAAAAERSASSDAPASAPLK